jgi:hypothetical protein
LLSDGKKRGSVDGRTSGSDRVLEAATVPTMGEASSKNPAPKKTDTIKAANTATEAR